MEKQKVYIWSRHFGEAAEKNTNNPISRIVRNPGMAKSEKRAVLASWASDARAIADHPQLRRLDDGTTVNLDDITTALKQLDLMPDAAKPVPLNTWLPRTRKIMPLRRHEDDDDDPPPAPAGIYPRPTILEGGEAAAA